MLHDKSCRNTDLHLIFTDDEVKRELSLRGELDSGDAYLNSLLDQLPDRLLASRSDSTVAKYQGYFRRFKQFMIENNKKYSPANSVHISLFLVHLLNSKCSHQVINSFICAIRWHHNLCGFSDPTDDVHVKTLLESSKRVDNIPHNKKDVFSPQVITDLFEKYNDCTNLSILRDLAMIIVAYCGFLRYNELSQLKCNDISFFDKHVKIIIRKSKTDQYRQGNEILLSKLSSIACPVKALTKYIHSAGIVLSSDLFLFRPLYKTKSSYSLKSSNRPLSYTRTKEVLLSRLKEVAPIGLDFGLHSLRASGATAAAAAGVNDRCWKRHGRWRSNACDRYIKDSINNRLQVSQKLGL
jgi:site-specific recombinase XerD